MTPRSPQIVLTIAGSDPCGGGGIQRDLMVFADRGVYGLSVITAVTSQNTIGVQRVTPVAGSDVQAQLQSLFDDFEIAAAKIGMLATGEVVEAVADFLELHPLKILILDPILYAKDGAPLLSPEGMDGMVQRLIPLATLVTPNLAEVEALVGFSVDSLESMRKAAQALRQIGMSAAVIKGGHLAGDPVDLLFEEDEVTQLSGERVQGTPVRGTGCMFSAVVAAEMAKGSDLKTAVQIAKELVTLWIRDARILGKGNRVVTRNKPSESERL